MKNKPANADQRSYWDANLDPTNLGDRLADARGVLRAEQHFYNVPDRKAFLATLSRLPAGLVLELGAGLSYQVIKLAELGYRVIACDLSGVRLQWLRTLAQEFLSPEAAQRIFYVVGRAEALPFRSQSVTCISTRAVLIHTELESALAECRRVLAPQGQVVFSEPMARHPLVNAYRATLAPPEWRVIACYFDDAEINLVRRFFPKVSLRFDYLTAFFAFIWQYGLRVPWLFWPTLRLLCAVDRALLAIIPPLRRYCWFVTLIGGAQQ